jgi:hypothetical protein
MIAALVAALACAPTPIHYEPLARSGALRGMPWVQGTPRRRGVFGVLFGYHAELGTLFAFYTHGVSPRGSAEKVLWIVRNRNASGQIEIRGRELGGAGTFRQRFSEVHDASAQPAKGREYASIIDLPSAGCWRLTVDLGVTRATLDILAVDA